MNTQNKPPTLLDWLGLKALPDFSKSRTLGAFLGAIALLVGVFLLFLLMATLWDFLRAAFRLDPYADDITGTAIRNIGLVLAAFFGAPFLVWRTWVASRQMALNEDALFNDKINAAATELAARRQVTEIARTKDGQIVREGSGAPVVATMWEDDVISRAAAIDRLEALAIEAIARQEFSQAQRIARMLSIYVQEFSRAHPALSYPTRPGASFNTSRTTDENPGNTTPTNRDSGLDATTSSGSLIREWAWMLSPIRSDVKRAVQSLGRINPLKVSDRIAFDPRNIDLAGCNLQGMKLRGLNFQGAKLGDARLEGADLGSTQLQGSDLWGAHLQAAVLGNAHLQGACLWEARLEGTILTNANLQGADLWEAVFDDETDLLGSDLSGASIRSARPRVMRLLRSRWSEIICSCGQLAGNAPPHWIRTEEECSYGDFLQTWRAWAATLDPPVIIAPDYNR